MSAEFEDLEQALECPLHLEQVCGSLEDTQRMIRRAGRTEEPRLVAELHSFDLLPRQWAQVLVPDAWASTDHPMRDLPPDTWRDLFNLAGYTYNGRRRARPRKPRTLYRGADPAHRDGWSWTDDRAVAEWFAWQSAYAGLHWPTPGRVWVADVEPHRLLARITEHREGESEYVVDTDGLEITELWAPSAEARAERLRREAERAVERRLAMQRLMAGEQA